MELHVVASILLKPIDYHFTFNVHKAKCLARGATNLVLLIVESLLVRYIVIK
jgi:hypothetical protein